MEIRALREGDERSRFRSGDRDLDRFFHQYAGQNQFRHYLGVTYIATEGPDLLGFATVSPGQIEGSDLPAGVRKRPPGYPLPVLRLGRLAVDELAQERGLGDRLLRFVLGLAVRMAGDYGCIGVVVDAKPDATEFYARYGFIPMDAVEGRSAARPQPAPMFLSLRAIKRSRL